MGMRKKRMIMISVKIVSERVGDIGNGKLKNNIRDNNTLQN